MTRSRILPRILEKSAQRSNPVKHSGAWRLCSACAGQRRGAAVGRIGADGLAAPGSRTPAGKSRWAAHFWGLKVFSVFYAPLWSTLHLCPPLAVVEHDSPAVLCPVPVLYHCMKLKIFLPASYGRTLVLVLPPLPHSTLSVTYTRNIFLCSRFIPKSRLGVKG